MTSQQIITKIIYDTPEVSQVTDATKLNHWIASLKEIKPLAFKRQL